jgi:hypothetical protein
MGQSFTTEDKSIEQMLEEGIEQRKQRARIAKKILNDKEIMGLFDEIKQGYHEAFESLTYGTTMEEYQTIHFANMALKQFLQLLTDYINADEFESRQEDIDKNTEDVLV